MVACRGVLGALAVCAVLSMHSSAQGDAARSTFSLDGEWRFALDPGRDGEASKWFAVDLDDRRWDRVVVPHCWPIDPRYRDTETVWYRRTFDAPPAGAASSHVRLEFGAVFARARVWLNGQLLGSHEGGYTPFAFDVSAQLDRGRPNVVALEVDSSWSTTTIPGARPGIEPTARVYPWWNYGGIVRSVALTTAPPVHVANQQIVATPNLEGGTASVAATIWVRNAGTAPATTRVSLDVARLDANDRVFPIALSPAPSADATVAPGETQAVRLTANLPRDAVRLWTLDRPVLYRAAAVLAASGAVAGDRHEATFGIRRFEVRGTSLLLNGKPVRLGGGNRVSDHPRFGLIEPREVVEQDLRLMKAAGMELQRISHYAPPPALLDAADRMGVLVIGEAGNWNLQPSQLDSPEMRADFQRQTREMIERDWNHPSVVAWSVGNEYASDTPSGVRWTRDMAAFVRGLDPSRPITFASYRAFRPDLARPEDEGSNEVDFVSINTYAAPENVGAVLDLVHSRWPDRPIFVSEFGWRADKAKDEALRQRYFEHMAAAFRTRPWIAGASIWTYNDYISRYPDTAPNGYRPWGLVEPDRTPRASYETVRQQFAVARLEAAALDGSAGGRPRLRATIVASSDFPSRPVEDLRVRVSPAASGGRLDMPETPTASQDVPRLEPGARVDIALTLPAGLTTAPLFVELMRADGTPLPGDLTIDAWSRAR